jgi:hypothetical protein
MQPITKTLRVESISRAQPTTSLGHLCPHRGRWAKSDPQIPDPVGRAAAFDERLVES